MKKIICIIISILIILSSFFVCLYAYTLNYENQKDYTSFQDVVSGYPKGATTIGNYEKDYYAMLDSCTYTCLNFFEASSVILSSDNVQAIIFASNKLFDSEEYDSIFALAKVFVREDGVFVLVTHKPDGRLAHSLYRMDNKEFVEQLNVDDLENEDIASDIVHDCFSSCFLFLKKYGIIFAIILTVCISSIFLLEKQKRNNQKQK